MDLFILLPYFTLKLLLFGKLWKFHYVRLLGTLYAQTQWSKFHYVRLFRTVRLLGTPEYELLWTQNVNTKHSSLRSQCWMRLFCNFQTLCNNKKLEKSSKSKFVLLTLFIKDIRRCLSLSVSRSQVWHLFLWLKPSNSTLSKWEKRGCIRRVSEKKSVVKLSVGCQSLVQHVWTVCFDATLSRLRFYVMPFRS